MLVESNNKISICTLFNDELLTLNNSEDWSVWLKRVRDLSDNTIRSFMKSMERFWIWSLYNPVSFEESFPSYQGRYRDALRQGFTIYQKVHDKEFESNIEIDVCSSKMMQKTTINKEIAGINSYFYFSEENDLIYDHRFINYLYEKQKSARSFLASIEIKKSDIAMNAFSEHKKYLPSYKISKNRQRIKYLPLELFDNLLEVAKPRERLIYLLCGACAARVGQALNLTLYDIDYDKEEIWLVDPKSDTLDIYGNKRRPWLKNEYDIDMLTKNIHNTPDLQFKYPIPLYHEPLFWINEEKYKPLFFETLREYVKSLDYLPESVRFPQHPFLFISKSGKRIHTREILTRFKRGLRKIADNTQFSLELNNLGLHSLRHMFGHAMAEIYARTGDDSLLVITQNAMGHSSIDSTMIYFSISGKTMRETIKRLTGEIYTSKEPL
jgi:integrase